MTKGEYCELKHLHIINPKFNVNEEADEDFKKNVDTLTEQFESIYNEENEQDI